MFPRSTICNRCGRTAAVAAWVPYGHDANEIAASSKATSMMVNCRIDCPICGDRVQLVQRPVGMTASQFPR